MPGLTQEKYCGEISNGICDGRPQTAAHSILPASFASAWTGGKTVVQPKGCIIWRVFHSKAAPTKLCIGILDATSDGGPQTNAHNSLPPSLPALVLGTNLRYSLSNMLLLKGFPSLWCPETYPLRWTLDLTRISGSDEPLEMLTFWFCWWHISKKYFWPNGIYLYSLDGNQWVARSN